MTFLGLLRGFVGEEQLFIKSSHNGHLTVNHMMFIYIYIVYTLLYSV